MSISKIIGLFGVKQTDIIIYVASILQNLGHRVLVLDNSYEQTMQFCIPKPVERLITTTYKNVDYENLVSFHDWKEKDYDYLIVDLGMWPEDEALSLCDEVFLVTDCALSRVERFREFMKRVKLPMSIIIRDVCSDVVSAKKIVSELQEENCFVVEWFSLPFNEEDFGSLLQMQHEGYRDFMHISKSFQKLLATICRRILDCEATIVWKGMKKARRGLCV